MYLFFVYIPFLWGERLYAITGVISLSVIPLKIGLVEYPASNPRYLGFILNVSSILSILFNIGSLSLTLPGVTCTSIIILFLLSTVRWSK